MSIFNRRYENFNDKQIKKEERKEGLKKLKEEQLSSKDIMALIIAMFQLILPFAIVVMVIYFLVILFIANL